MTLGGGENPMFSEEVIAKHLEKVQSAEFRKKVSTTMKRYVKEGRLFTPEHRRKLSEKAKGNQAFRGKTHSTEWRKNMSELKSGAGHHMYGKHHTDEARKKIQINCTHRKTVIMLDTNIDELNEFISLGEAGRYLINNKLCKSSDFRSVADVIAKAAKNDKKAYGYYWVVS